MRIYICNVVDGMGWRDEPVKSWGGGGIKEGGSGTKKNKNSSRGGVGMERGKRGFGIDFSLGFHDSCFGIHSALVLFKLFFFSHLS